MALYKRPGSKYYWMKFTFDSQLVQRSTKCKNRRDAETVESAFRTQLALGKVGVRPKPKPPTFKQAVEDFLKWSEVNHVQKPNSYKRMKFSCQPLKDFFGETRADRIERKDIEKYIFKRLAQASKKTQKTISRTTVNLELVVLKTIFRRLISGGFLSESPARGIKSLAKDELRFHVITPTEEKVYLLACPQPVADVAAVMLETGMRPTELYHLKRENVFLEKGFLQVENGKTKTSNRKIWLSEKASDILRRRLEKFKGEFLFPKGEKDGEPPTYPLDQTHRAAVRKLGLDFRLYDCRHTYATRELENGTDLLTLAAILGHSNLDELQRYAHVSEARKREVATRKDKGQAKAV
jgi:integrase